jgi:hypothetical protein
VNTSQPSGVLSFRHDLFIPSYRPMRRERWALCNVTLNLAPGYWSGVALIENMATLTRDDETWMSMTPMELESQEIGVRLARGHVLIFGLGMGWSAAASALNEAVTSVTVVEADRDVLGLHRDLDIFAQLPAPARDKIRLIEGDAYQYRPEKPVDLLMPDIWLPLINDGRIDEVRRMQANVAAGAIYFWGQEMEIARHAVAADRALDAAGIAATIADFALPLIGPELPDYPEKLRQAARRWMRDRWLPGSTPPDLS